MSTEAPAVAIKYSKREKGGYYASIGSYQRIVVEKGYIFPSLPSGRWDAKWLGQKGWGSTRDEAVRDLLKRHAERKQALNDRIEQQQVLAAAAAAGRECVDQT